MEFTFVQPVPVESENWKNRLARSRWGQVQLSAYNNNWKEAVRDGINVARHTGVLPKEELNGLWSVLVTFQFDKQRKRDPHNYVGTTVKPIIDQMVTMGVFPDDNANFVNVPQPVLEIVRFTPVQRDQGTDYLMCKIGLVQL